jgi:hypothetical protein
MFFDETGTNFVFVPKSTRDIHCAGEIQGFPNPPAHFWGSLLNFVEFVFEYLGPAGPFEAFSYDFTQNSALEWERKSSENSKKGPLEVQKKKFELRKSSQNQATICVVLRIPPC